jgi:hypothetical protein
LIVPLVRDLLRALRDVAGFLRTAAIHSTLRDTYNRLLARVSVNNRNEAVSAYCLTLQGRAEMRNKEVGFSTQTADIPMEIGFATDSVNLKAHIKDGHSYDEGMAALAEIILNTEPMWNDDESVPSAFGAEFQATDHDAEDIESTTEFPLAEDYKRCLVQFASMDEAALSTFDPYRDMYALARQCIRMIAINSNLDEHEIMQQFDKWQFHSATGLPFLQDVTSSQNQNLICRTAHRFEDWASFPELALRFITCGTSEADAERIISMQRNIVGLHGK